MKFPSVLPAPWYRDPAETVVVDSDAPQRCEPVVEGDAARRPERDRYYTMARRVRVRQAMRGVR